jgi:hypothetical protein
MPTVALHLAEFYDAGTSVGAYAVPAIHDHAPTTAAVETVTTDSNGVATFTTLTAGAEYVAYSSGGPNIEFTVPNGNVTASDLSVTGTATVAGAVTLQSDLIHTGTKVGFFSTTPAARPSAYTQTYSTATRTHANPTAVAVATTAATNSSPYGFAQAQADAIVTAVNALVVDVAGVKQVLNSVIDDLQTLGLAH